MEFQWNKLNKDYGVSDKELLQNPRAFHSYAVENSITRVLLEIMEQLEKAEKKKAQK